MTPICEKPSTGVEVHILSWNFDWSTHTLDIRGGFLGIRPPYFFFSMASCTQKIQFQVPWQRFSRKVHYVSFLQSRPTQFTSKNLKTCATADKGYVTVKLRLTWVCQYLTTQKLQHFWSIPTCQHQLRWPWIPFEKDLSMVFTTQNAAILYRNPFHIGYEIIRKGRCNFLSGPCNIPLQHARAQVHQLLCGLTLPHPYCLPGPP